jgi:hypothetical protein
MGIVESRDEAVERIWVTVEPRAGHSDAEIVNTLREAGAEDVEVLAPGFVSAHTDTATLGLLDEIADVHVKARKQMRSF